MSPRELSLATENTDALNRTVDGRRQELLRCRSLRGGDPALQCLLDLRVRLVGAVEYLPRLRAAIQPASRIY